MEIPNVPDVSEVPGDARGLTRLLHAVQELSLARSLAEIQAIVRTAARELTGCDGATFVLRDDGKCYYADEDAIAPLWKGSRFPMEICISGWAMLNRTPAVIPDIYSDPRVPHAAYRPTFVRSLVMVPIRTLDPVGAIGNYWAREHEPTAREVSLLQALADSTSIAMENVAVNEELEQRVRDRTADLERANEEIHRLSRTDDLTGLANRRGFHLLAEEALRIARSRGRRCLLAYLDVDGLKRVNDEAGHEVGDRLIADVGSVLRTAVRPSDIVARLGGDEFCALLVDYGGDGATLKQRLTDALRDFQGLCERPYRLAASVGVLEVPPTDVSTLDELLAHADQLMYEDKKRKPLTLPAV
ncbi:GGDEF domain-containing protein [Mycobacterium sp. C3-094]|uniref:GGDEF domain-containing protein n=1 Tax=Mycobacterium sp. PSTR-4-N TaxID=2917745 RepID=UPI001F14C6DE|nr:sensor domain-containing diguanylate cyclase [Mycobacterium sp. PSTR-4-N]MCG7592598.1 sensor domain-containing diguanylate cyclase [Mycobacterium sp. PSTR-4-N]